MNGSILKSGKVAPQAEKPITAHSEQILIAMRKDGINPNMNTPKPIDDTTVNTTKQKILNPPPA